MNWTKETLYFPRYKYVSSNQHGDRFRRLKSKQLSVAVISCKTNDANGLTKLILLSHTLDVPVRYDFEKQEACIEVVSNEALKECM